MTRRKKLLHIHDSFVNDNNDYHTSDWWWLGWNMLVGICRRFSLLGLLWICEHQWCMTMMYAMMIGCCDDTMLYMKMIWSLYDDLDVANGGRRNSCLVWNCKRPKQTHQHQSQEQSRPKHTQAQEQTRPKDTAWNDSCLCQLTHLTLLAVFWKVYKTKNIFHWTTE